MAIKAFVDTIDKFNTWVGKGISFLVYFMIAVLCFEIFGRGLFNSPTIWAHELTGYLFGAYFMLGGAYTLKEGGHINVDIFSSKFTARQRAIVDIITSVLILLFLFILAWFSFGLLVTQIQRKEVSQTVFAPPVFPLSLVVVIGSVLFLLQAIAKLVRDVVFVVKGRDIDPDVKAAVKDREEA